MEATAVIGVEHEAQALANLPSDRVRDILFLGGMLRLYPIVANVR
jgi:hypothetical protein